MSADGLVDVDFTDDPGSVAGGRSVTTGSGPPTGGRWPLGAFRFNRQPAFPETIILGKDAIRNGDVERDEGWKRYGTPRIHQRSREQAHGGSHAFKVIGSGGAGVRQYLPGTSTGQRFQLSGWLYVARGTVRLIVFDGKKLQYGSTATGPTWTRMTMSFSVADGSTPYVGAQTVGGETMFYLDDVICRPVEKVERSSRLVLGWVCTAGGNPGTWVPVHVDRR